MKRTFLLTLLAIAVSLANAQNSYIVKTSNVKNQGSEATTNVADGEKAKEEQQEEATDFLSKYFKYQSLCDWQEGMKFMVIPEKYDLIVSQFFDAVTKKSIGMGKLRYKILIYKNHDEDDRGTARLNFYCPDDEKSYYYEILNGSFEDYCYGKIGVPALAYLGDVDIAREKLMGQKLYTNNTKYYIDTEVNGDGIQEVKVNKNIPVEVVAVGVGTRNYPVKIIVKDAKGNEFFQTVAMSKTNSGVRNDEFHELDNKHHEFYNSFQLADANVKASGEYSKYIGRKVYTRYATTMENEAGEKVKIARNSQFIIKSIEAQNDTKYVKMTLEGVTSKKNYYKQVTFKNDNVAGDIDGYKEDYYFYLFSDKKLTGKGPSITISKKTRRNR